MVAAGDEIVVTDITTIEDYTIRRPVGFMQQAVAQSMPDNTMTAITWTTETYDTHGYHDTAVNNTRVTPLLAGYYTVEGAYWSASMTTPVSIDAFIRKNGVTTIPAGTKTLGVSTTQAMWAGTQIEMNGSTDYFELCGTQDSTGAVNTTVSSRFTSFLLWRFERPL